MASASKSATQARRASVEQSFEEIYASLTPAQQLLLDEPDGLLPIEIEDFHHQVVVFHDAITPRDGLEVLQVIDCAIQAIEVQRYRRADAELLAEKTRAVMREKIGVKATPPVGATPEERDAVWAEAAASNDAIVRDWMRGDKEALRKIRLLIKGCTTEAEVLAKANDITMEQRRPLMGLAARAEAAIRRTQRDITWRRNMKRLMLKDGMIDAGSGNDNSSLAMAAGDHGG